MTIHPFATLSRPLLPPADFGLYFVTGSAYNNSPRPHRPQNGSRLFFFQKQVQSETLSDLYIYMCTEIKQCLLASINGNGNGAQVVPVLDIFAPSTAPQFLSAGTSTSRRWIQQCFAGWWAEQPMKCHLKKMWRRRGEGGEEGWINY